MKYGWCKICPTAAPERSRAFSNAVARLTMIFRAGWSSAGIALPLATAAAVMGVSDDLRIRPTVSASS